MIYTLDKQSAIKLLQATQKAGRNELRLEEHFDTRKFFSDSNSEAANEKNGHFLTKAIDHRFGERFAEIGVERNDLRKSDILKAEYIGPAVAMRSDLDYVVSAVFDQQIVEEAAGMSWDQAQRIKPAAERPGEKRRPG